MKSFAMVMDAILDCSNRGDLARVGGEAGAIVIDRVGRVGVAHNSAHFALALASSALEQPRVALHRNELKDLLDHD